MESLYPPLIGQLIKRYPHWPLDPSCSVGGGSNIVDWENPKYWVKVHYMKYLLWPNQTSLKYEKKAQMNPHGMLYLDQIKKCPICLLHPSIYIFRHFATSRCLLLGQSWLLELFNVTKPNIGENLNLIFWKILKNKEKIPHTRTPVLMPLFLDGVLALGTYFLLR